LTEYIRYDFPSVSFQRQLLLKVVIIPSPKPLHMKRSERGVDPVGMGDFVLTPLKICKMGHIMF